MPEAIADFDSEAKTIGLPADVRSQISKMPSAIRDDCADSAQDLREQAAEVHGGRVDLPSLAAQTGARFHQVARAAFEA